MVLRSCYIYFFSLVPSYTVVAASQFRFLWVKKNVECTGSVHTGSWGCWKVRKVNKNLAAASSTAAFDCSSLNHFDSKQFRPCCFLFFPLWNKLCLFIEALSEFLVCKWTHTTPHVTCKQCAKSSTILNCRSSAEVLGLWLAGNVCSLNALSAS